MGEVEDYISNLDGSLQEEKTKNLNLHQAMAGSSFPTKDGNLIHFQLDLSETLNMIEHFLRGEYLTSDDKGNEFWIKPTKPLIKDGKEVKDKKGNVVEVIDEDRVLFNDYGVNVIMTIVTSYLNKNTPLSYYTETRIYAIMADLGDEITDFIFCNYERMGMTTEFKKSRYNLIVLMLLHIIETAYRRAIDGRTSKEINQTQIVTQSDYLGGRGGMVPEKKKSWWNPFS